MSTAVALHVIRRKGSLSGWDPDTISAAITTAFLAVEGTSASGSPRIHDEVASLTQTVATALTRRAGATRALHIEDIQDQVELALMRAEYHKVARAYVLYRESRADARRRASVVAPPPALWITRPDRSTAPIDLDPGYTYVSAQAAPRADGRRGAALRHGRRGGAPLLVHPLPESYRDALQAMATRCERESAGGPEGPPLRRN